MASASVVSSADSSSAAGSSSADASSAAGASSSAGAASASVPAPRSLRLRRGLFLAAELLDARVDEADEVLQRRVEQAGERRERRDDRAEHLPAQHVERRQLREALDLGRRHRASLHDAAADLEHLRLARGVGKRLGGRDHVAVGLEERDRARPVEQREQRIRAGGLGRAARERVLDDGEARAALEQPRAQLVDLRHRQPAIVGDEQRVRGLQARGQLLDNVFFLISSHLTSTGLLPSRGGLPVVSGGQLLGRNCSGLLQPARPALRRFREFGPDRRGCRAPSCS